MQLRLLAALAALVSASALSAQTVDPQYAAPIPGRWTYSAAPDGSEAWFVNAGAPAQLAVHCTRATRQVHISKPATAAIATLGVWTSEMSRNLPAGFDAAAGRINSVLPAYDPLLDALAFSRARIAVTVAGAAPLVLPSAPEVARIVEDCRS